ncbi:MAG: ABC-F family ATP-binding cassette domain-containing protein [Balneolaceae bacterium]
MLQLDSITLRFGERTLFQDVHCTINPGERVGLAGPNGAGKSTLMKIITGDFEPDSGEVLLGGNRTVGYLPQDGIDPDPSLTLFLEVESAFREILKLRRDVEEVQQKMASFKPGSEESDRATDRFGTLQERLELSGSYTLRSDIERVLKGLGFQESDFDRPVTEFSGGWLMRIALAKLLLQKPDYLLLDEPTNHLDIESLQWLEQFLEKYEGAVVVISHDRAFLDKITRRTLALRGGMLRDYAGNYTFFEKKYREEREQLIKEKANREKERKQTEEFIDRFRYKATKAKQVQSRIRQLEKEDEIEIEDDQEEISFRFPTPERSGLVVMELKGVSKSYGENRVFSDLDYQVERGDKVAVVGPNGAGKSTLIRILAGLEPIDSGELKTGHNVTPSYFAQHQAEELNPKKTVLEELRESAPLESESRLRTLLGCFLFRGDDVFKKVSVLSGGEKSRLALSKMLIAPSNFIILDEPTNHLDMQSREILQQALNLYEGTCMIVTHDRDFADSIVKKTLEVQPGRVKTWPGHVSHYLEMRELAEQESQSSESNRKSENGKGENGSLSRKEVRRIEAQKRQKLASSVNPLKERLRKLEESIASMEERIGEIEALMADTSFYSDEEQVKATTMEYEKLKSDLSNSYSKWEELAGRINYLESETE